MEHWQAGLLLLVAVWALQAVGTWVQMRHYRSVMGDIARRWPDGWMGAGHARGTFRKGVVAVVVVTPDEIVRKVLLMEGRSVFAKFVERPEFQGWPLDRLTREAFKPAEKSRNAALEMAVKQIRSAQGRIASPSEPVPSKPLHLAQA